MPRVSKALAPITLSQLFGLTDEHIVWLNDKIGIHHLMVESFQRLVDAAKDDGISIEIASGFRSFERQLSIWNNKYQGISKTLDINELVVDINELSSLEKIKAIMLFSALPGASRHHWGTDIDVFAPQYLHNGQQLQLETWEYQENGPFYPLTLWLAEHAQHFGFYQPYDCYRNGIAPEPWHLSYYPLAQAFEDEMTCDKLTQQMSVSDILGKAEIIDNIAFLYQRYITNISRIN